MDSAIQLYKLFHYFFSFVLEYLHPVYIHTKAKYLATSLSLSCSLSLPLLLTLILSFFLPSYTNWVVLLPIAHSSRSSQIQLLLLANILKHICQTLENAYNVVSESFNIELLFNSIFSWEVFFLELHNSFP